jgi:hypothetical protein
MEKTVLNNCTTPHVHFLVDLGFVATVSFTASGVLYHNCTKTHDWFPGLLVHNCTAPQNDFCIDLGSAATVSFTANSVLFHNYTTLCMGFRVDLSKTQRLEG